MHALAVHPQHSVLLPLWHAFRCVLQRYVTHTSTFEHMVGAVHRALAASPKTLICNGAYKTFGKEHTLHEVARALGQQARPAMGGAPVVKVPRHAAQALKAPS
jgi:hypothetical protein